MDYFKGEIIKHIIDSNEDDIERLIADLASAYYEDEDVDLQNVIDHLKEKQDD